jgi:hypothetical protein
MHVQTPESTVKYIILSNVVLKVNKAVLRRELRVPLRVASQGGGASCHRRH